MKKVLLICAVVLCVRSLYAQVPTVTSFSPSSGPVGTVVTITGINFSATAASNTVYFGATKATCDQKHQNGANQDHGSFPSNPTQTCVNIGIKAGFVPRMTLFNRVVTVC